MFNVISTGTINLVDLNDSKQLKMFISNSQPKTQIYDVDSNSLIPNWTASSPVLTPQLYIAGTSIDVINDAKSINWYEGNSDTPISNGSRYTLGTGNKTLTINKNIVADVNLRFDGYNDYAKTDNNIVTSPTSLTISSWFKKLGHGSNFECVIHHGSSNTVGSSSYWLGLSDDDYLTATIGANVGAGHLAGQTTVQVELDVWYHLCATWDGSTVKVYVNGVLEKSYALASYANITAPTRIGASADGTNYMYNGVVKDVQIWTKALTQSEIQNNMNKELSGSETGIVGLWKLDEETGSIANDSAGANDMTISGAEWISQKRGIKRLNCEVVYNDTDTGFDVVAKASVELNSVESGSKGAKGDKGDSAVMSVLSNDFHSVPTDSNGDNGDYSSATSKIIIYLGTSDDTSNWSISANASSGVTGSLSGDTYTATGMTSDTGYVDITATKSGYTSITKRFNLVKNKQGIAGQNGSNADIRWLVCQALVIKKDLSGNYTPSTFTISGKYKNGMSAISDYNSILEILETTDGTSYTSMYKSVSLESSYTHTLSENIKGVKARLFLNNGTTLIDEQTIPVISDGATGAVGNNANNLVVWTPNGNIIKNGKGIVTGQADMYDGLSVANAKDYRWFRQNPNESAGDYANDHIKQIHDDTFANGASMWSEEYSGETVATTTKLTSATVDGKSVVRMVGTDWFYSVNPIPVDTSKTYEMTFKVKQEVNPTSGGSKVYAGVATLDENYNPITGGAGTHRYFCISGATITVADGWMTYTGTITGTGDNGTEFREGTKYVRPMFIVNYSDGDGTVVVDEITFIDVESKNSAQGWETLDNGKENFISNTKNPVGDYGDNYWNNAYRVYDSHFDENVFLIIRPSSSELTSKSNRITVNPNTKYTISVWLKRSGNVKSVDVFFLSRREGEVDDFTIIQSKASITTQVDNWEKVTWTFTTDLEAYDGYVRIDNNGSSDGLDSYLHFTEVKMEKGGIATPHRLTLKEEKIEPEDNNMYGRNILTGTSNELTNVSFSGWDNYLQTIQLSDYNLKAGDYLTARIFLKPQSYETKVHLDFRNESNDEYKQYFGNIISEGTEGYSTLTVEIPSNTTMGNMEAVTKVRFSIRHSSGTTPTNIVDYKEPKLELGQVYSDWTPSPEDNSELYPTAENGVNSWIFQKHEGVSGSTIPTYDTVKSNQQLYKTIIADGVELIRDIGDYYYGYLRTAVYVSDDKTINFSLNHDNGMTMFVNSISQYEYVTNTSASISAKLKKGWNSLEFIFDESGGGDGIWDVSPTISSQVEEMNCYYSLEYGSLRGVDGVKGYNTPNITIPANAIVNLEGFKCLVDYDSKIYTDIIVVNDVSDPYNIVVLGTNTFKNGQGSSTFTAKLFRNGEEVDVDGTGGFTYSWYIYNSDDSLNTSFNKTGKTITVTADDIDNEGRLVCEVDV